jgi:hypothetical protein
LAEGFVCMHDADTHAQGDMLDQLNMFMFLIFIFCRTIGLNVLMLILLIAMLKFNFLDVINLGSRNLSVAIPRLS